jgi:hypothetical protein
MITIVTRCDGCGLAPFKCLCLKSHAQIEESVYLFRVIMACGRSKPPESVVYTLSEHRPPNCAVLAVVTESDKP